MKTERRASLTNQLRLRKLKKMTSQINGLEMCFRHLSDQDLASKTAEFKERLSRGEVLDHLLIEAFATVREVSRRILGLFPYDVQLMGAIALHQGYIAEMKTGEGKTLTATMPLYLNALTGKGAILVTTNDYLARRDAEEMGKIFQFLGLSVGVGVFKDDEEVDVEVRKAVYQADVTYTTSTALGFDYLSDNLVTRKEDKILRPFHYVIVDEADAVLLDNAQTPLIVSGTPRVQSNLFASADIFVRQLKKDVEYYFNKDTKDVYLTESGIDFAERYFAISDLYHQDYWELNRQINLALRAHHLFKRDYDYVVYGDDVKLLDHKTGRVLEGMRLQSGIHQAIECKEKVKLSKETRAIASVTYQSLFNMFPKLAGMTGSGKMAEEELIDTYRLSVISIPTHLPIRRIDYPDLVFASLPEKLYATLALVKDLHSKGQPILLISGSVEITEIYSKLLLQEGIAHNTLTAKNIAKEAQIIKEAGQKGAVTCATVLAGRGTDIKLGPGVEDLGGLAVIGTERMGNSRMDWQLRGRSGRQGQVGMSQFFVSLEDDLLIQYGPEWVKRLYKKYNENHSQNYGQPLTSRRFKKVLRQAQEKSEDMARLSRQSTITFDESLRVQRNLIYNLRDDLIMNDRNLSEEVYSIYLQVVQDYLAHQADLTNSLLRRYILDNYSYHFTGFPRNMDFNDKRSVKGYFISLFKEELYRKTAILHTEEAIADFYRQSILRAIDDCWVEEVDSLQQLKRIVTTRAHAQRDSIHEYYKESLRSYEEMASQVRERIVRNIMLSTIEIDKDGNFTIYFV